MQAGSLLRSQNIAPGWNTAMMTTDHQERKDAPMARGLLDYFVGSQQHNPGEELHWARHLSTDHADCIVRHLVDRGTIDTDGCRHSAKVAWRALALLQTEIENERAAAVPPEAFAPCEGCHSHVCESTGTCSHPWQRGTASHIVEEPF